MYELEVKTVHKILKEENLEAAINIFKRGGHSSRDMNLMRKGETIVIEDVFCGSVIKTTLVLKKVDA